MATPCTTSLGSLWPDDLYFVVPASGGILNDGDAVFTLPTRFRNWKIRVVRNNIPNDFQQQVLGDPYFDVDITLNEVTIVPAASLGDKFMIQAYKPAT
jgi:hypothetical protein